MITRYARPTMMQLWSPNAKFQRWLDVELAACHIQHQLGAIPDDAYQDIVARAAFDVSRIDAIEAEIHHDVIAFLTSVAEIVGPSSRYIHLGLTSSDVVDTAFSLLIQDAGKVLLTDHDQLMAVVSEQARRHQYTPMMGRTHGVHAEPTTFGLKLTVWYDELKRNRVRLTEALEQLRVGKLSGAVGNYAHLSPAVEEAVCAQLGLKAAPISTQIIQRDRHAHFVTTLAIIAGSLETMATEIRALQKTECHEVLEPFSKSQKGSSAMPHKRNPILCERVAGLARTIRGYALAALENQNLWHERDISHSSVERIIMPDATVTLDYMFGIMTSVVQDMTVNTDQMAVNIDRSHHVFYSQQVLLALVNAGMTREDAYRLVQSVAMTAVETHQSFIGLMMAHPTVTSHLDPATLSSLFVMDKYTHNVGTIFDRVYSQ